VKMAEDLNDCAARCAVLFESQQLFLDACKLLIRLREKILNGCFGEDPSLAKRRSAESGISFVPSSSERSR
jgi:hypothetical protein